MGALIDAGCWCSNRAKRQQKTSKDQTQGTKASERGGKSLVEEQDRSQHLEEARKEGASDPTF